jgi:hypothetical protein
MKSGLLIVAAAVAMGGCAERFVQDVTYRENTLIVRECIMENGGAFQEKCVERKYLVK